MSKSHSLSRYLAGNIALFAIPLFLASGLSLWTLNILATRSFTDVASLSARLLSSRFEEFFERPKEESERLADLILHEELYPRARLGDYLRDAMEGYPYIQRVQVVAPEGRVVAISPFDPDSIGVSRRGEQVYEEVKASKSLYWSESYISAWDNQPALSFGGQVEGYVILCDLDLKWVADYAAGISLASAPGVEVRVTDGKGVYLFHPEAGRVSRRELMPDFPRLKALSSRPGTSNTLREGGKAWIVSSSKLASPDWHVFLLYPESMFTDSLFRVYLEFLSFALLVGVGGIWFWRARFRRVSLLFAAIPAEAERISRGDYEELESFGEGFEEFERVGESMNRMVTAIGRREKILLDREGAFHSTLERIDLAAVTVDLDLRLSYANPFFLARTGFSLEAVFGRPITGILSCGERVCPFVRAVGGEELAPLERCALRTRGGEELIFDWSIVPNLDSEGRLAAFTGIGHDLTGMVRNQRQLGASLREKEILLREVHHRVKNNLQVILSLLHLQELDAADQGIVKALHEAGNRILSIALVHESIYASEDFADLDFGSYASSLAAQLVNQPEAGSIDFRTRLETLRLDLIEAVPCGLFLNEALGSLIDREVVGEGGRRRVIELSVGWAEGKAVIAVFGTGEGLDPERPDLAERGLMEALVLQLGGEFGLRREAGGILMTCSFTPRREIAPGPS